MEIKLNLKVFVCFK